MTTLTDDQRAAIQQWLDFGQQMHDAGHQGGYYSGNGWGAVTLRSLIEEDKTGRDRSFVFIGARNIAIVISTMLGGKWPFKIEPVENAEDHWRITVDAGLASVVTRLHVQLQDIPQSPT